MNEHPNFTEINQAHVYLRDHFVGTLERLSSQSFRFQYDINYLNQTQPLPIATSFPLSKTPYESKSLPSFFENLILEGWLAHYMEKKLHIDRSDHWACLMATGSHPIGAVSVRPVHNTQGELNLNHIFSSQLSRKDLHPYKNNFLQNFDRCPILF